MLQLGDLQAPRNSKAPDARRPGTIQGLADQGTKPPDPIFNFNWWPACLLELCTRSLQLCQFEFVSWRRYRWSEVVRVPERGTSIKS